MFTCSWKLCSVRLVRMQRNNVKWRNLCNECIVQSGPYRSRGVSQIQKLKGMSKLDSQHDYSSKEHRKSIKKWFVFFVQKQGCSAGCQSRRVIWLNVLRWSWSFPFENVSLCAYYILTSWLQKKCLAADSPSAKPIFLLYDGDFGCPERSCPSTTTLFPSSWCQYTISPGSRQQTNFYKEALN